MSARQAKQVIVVGSGLAGLSAASQLVLHNVPVIMLERAERPGGNSIKASSGINGAPTKFQPCDDDEFFYADTIKSAGKPFSTSSGESRAYRERLISTLVDSSSDAISWLADEKKVDLTKVAQLGGHSRPRTHRGAGQKPPGADIIGTLLQHLNGSPMFELRTNAKVTKVLQDAKEVIGVDYTKEDQTHHLHGPVVFASGGFAGDISGMISKYRPDLTSFPSTNEARDGSHTLLESVGAVTIDMDHVQVHPTGFVDDKDRGAAVKFLAAEVLRGEGGILLLKNGSRFVNELETREHVTNAITGSDSRLETELQQWDITLVLDEGAASALTSHVKFYLWKGILRKTTIGELDQEQITKTVQEYADVVAGQKADKFGRKTFGSWGLTTVQPDSIVYVAKVTPVLHFTMGGVKYNERSQVLDVAAEPILGLWAAGEVTGGLHGQNRLAGSSLLECAVFGRIAGNEAASFFRQQTS